MITMFDRLYVALEFCESLGMARCAPDTLCGAKECPESPVCSLVWSGAVVGAPGADNLKIRPEFFPGGFLEFRYCCWAEAISVMHQ